jgi:hypothetical protein
MRAARGSTVRRVSIALARRLRRRLGHERGDRAIVNAAARGCPMLKKPVFIGIAGSAGKPRPKELLAGMRPTACVEPPPCHLNALPKSRRATRRVRRTHDFCVAELSEAQPGAMVVPLICFVPTSESLHRRRQRPLECLWLARGHCSGNKRARHLASAGGHGRPQCR